VGHNVINKIIIYTSNFHIKYQILSGQALGISRRVPNQPRILAVLVNNFPIDISRGERGTRNPETA